MDVSDIFASHDFGRLMLRVARSEDDMAEVAMLRKSRFRGNKIGDLDRFDPLCTHLLITERTAPEALACARLRLLTGPALQDGYSAQYYDLSPMVAAGLRALELGRVCIAETRRQDPDMLRVLLAGIALYADSEAVDVLMGCASFKSNDPVRHASALGWLRARHVGPDNLSPLKRDALAFDLPQPGSAAEQKSALHSIPPLLRMYIGMGGWVSDHAVSDPVLDTLHVFTAVEIGRIPPNRKRVLMGMAQPR